MNTFGKEEEEKKAEEVSPPEDLMREHGVLKRILLIYGEAIRRIEANQELPPGRWVTRPKSSASSSKIITRSSRRTSFSRVSRKRTNSSISLTCYCSSIKPDDA